MGIFIIVTMQTAKLTTVYDPRHLITAIKFIIVLLQSEAVRCRFDQIRVKVLLINLITELEVCCWISKTCVSNKNNYVTSTTHRFSI